MIVLLLNSFMNLLPANEIDNSFTGKIEKTDTTVVIVPINIIKQANIKLTERVYLKHKLYHQELLINQYKNLNIINDSIIYKYKNDLINANNININLNKQIVEERRRNNKLTKISICGLSISIITIVGILIYK